MVEGSFDTLRPGDNLPVLKLYPLKNKIIIFHDFHSQLATLNTSQFGTIEHMNPIRWSQRL